MTTEKTETKAETAITTTSVPGNTQALTLLAEAADAGTLQTILAKPIDASSLDKALRCLDHAERAGGECLYIAGTIAAGIKASKAWTSKKKKSGENYRTLQRFVEKETRFSIGYFHKLAKLATSYTAAEIAEHGASTLIAVLTAEKEDRPILDAEVKTGKLKSKRAVESRKKALAAARPPKKKKKKTKARPAAATVSVPKASPREDARAETPPDSAEAASAPIAISVAAPVGDDGRNKARVSVARVREIIGKHADGDLTFALDFGECGMAVEIEWAPAAAEAAE